MLSSWSIDLWSRQDIYTTLKEFSKVVKQTGAYDKLDFEQQRYMTKIIEDMENSGVNLSDEKRKQVV